MRAADRYRTVVALALLSLFGGCTAPDDPAPVESELIAPEPVGSALIAFVSDREGAEALFLMDADGTGVRRLTQELPPVSHPSWSADGRRLAFNAGSPPGRATST